MVTLPSIEDAMPNHFDLYFGGKWAAPTTSVKSGTAYKDTVNPGNGKVIHSVAQASAQDVDAAVKIAHKAFLKWRKTTPMERATILRQAAETLRSHATHLALVDSYNTGNPVSEMLNDANVAAAYFDYFAGLIPMIKGETIPQGEDTFHYTIREPLGVVGRIVAFNHPLMFGAGKLAAPLAAGNTVIIKPPEQAPLSCLKLAEILGGMFPPGVISILPGGVECGQALSTHPLVKAVTLIGSVPTGKAIQKSAADSLKVTLLELGGKNALIVFPDADLDKAAASIAGGMNFTWSGQSCGSTSRVFLHSSLHDKVLENVVARVKRDYKPGVPTELSTTLGPVVSKVSHDRVLSYIESAKKQGARLLTGGKVPDDKHIEGGFFIEPTIFADVTTDMRIAREEIFGPVMSVFKWENEDTLFEQVDSVEYGLTASIFSENSSTIQNAIKNIDAGYIWVNQTSRHFLNVPFGGHKMSGYGREECFEELLTFTQLKSVNVKL